MAKIVLGVASSHSPQLNISAENWPLLRQKDESDPRLNYDELLQKARPEIGLELTMEKMQDRDSACQKALDSLAAVIRQVAPDVLVTIGDDQHEQFMGDNMPMFSIYYGDKLPLGTKQGRQGDPGLHGMAKAWQQAERHELSEDQVERTGAPGLARHLIESLVEDEFDISCSNQLNADIGLGHAFNFVYRRLAPEGDIPMVPLMVNTFYPPNAPTPKRCYTLGQALRRAIERWDSAERVAIIASGGLSHTIVDEELDLEVLDAMLEKDQERLRSLEESRITLGTSEVRNWIIMAGAMEPMDMLLAQYVPAYRTPAGTGCGMGFAYWM